MLIQIQLNRYWNSVMVYLNYGQRFNGMDNIAPCAFNHIFSVGLQFIDISWNIYKKKMGQMRAWYLWVICAKLKVRDGHLFNQAYWMIHREKFVAYRNFGYLIFYLWISACNTVDILGKHWFLHQSAVVSVQTWKNKTVGWIPYPSLNFSSCSRWS